MELQIRAEPLRKLIGVAVQERLRTVCIPGMEQRMVDHLDVVEPISFVTVAGAVEAHVPVAAYLVSEDDLAATVNGVPAGATASALQIRIVLRLSVVPATSNRDVPLELRYDRIEPAGVGGLLPPIFTDPLVTAPLEPALRALGIPTPPPLQVTTTDDAIVVGLVGLMPPLTHLRGDQDWGIFLTVADIERLIHDRMPQNMPNAGPPTMTWRPQNDHGRMHVMVVAKPDVEPLDAEFKFSFDCDLDVVPDQPALRTTVAWNVGVDLGVLAPYEDIVAAHVKAMTDPRAWGATPLGPQQFATDAPLPLLSFGRASLVYETAYASPAGLTVGGPTRMVVPPREQLFTTLTAESGVFSEPIRIELCSQTSGGKPTMTARPEQVSSGASVVLKDPGHLCGVDLAENSAWLQTYMRTRTGERPDETIVSVRVPCSVAPSITAPVQLTARTARGVRRFDLGIPPRIEIDADGNVKGAIVDFIDDCAHVVPEDRPDGGSVDIGKQILDADLNPLRDDWETYIDQTGGLKIQVVGLDQLEAGETVLVRSAGSEHSLAADSEGRLAIPILTAPASSVGVRVSRANGRSLAGHCTVESVVYWPDATVARTEVNSPGAIRPGELTSLPSLGAQLEELTRTKTPDVVHGRLSGEELRQLAHGSGAIHGSNGVMTTREDWAAYTTPDLVQVFRVSRGTTSAGAPGS